MDVMMVIKMGNSSILHVSPSGGLIVELRKSIYEATQDKTTRIRQTISTIKILETYTITWNSSSRPVAELGSSNHPCITDILNL